MGVQTRENEFSWIRYIRYRLRKNKNFLAPISGPTGSGKTWTAGSICGLLDPSFFDDPDRVVFNAKQLMALVNSGKLKKGSTILFDESGVEMNARNWQSITNKIINYLIQTFRSRNWVLIFTSPYLDFIDSSTRKLFHAEFETVSINHEEKTCTIKGKLLQYNSHMKKFYRKYLRAYVPGKGFLKVTIWRVPKPPERWIVEYEKRKLQFTTDLNKRIMQELERADKKSKGKKQYNHTCKKCNYEWEGIKEFPKRCPECNDRLKYTRKTQEIAQNGGESA